MPSAPGEALKVSPAVERFVRQLCIAGKAVSLYPASSSIPQEASALAAEYLGSALRELPEVRILIDKSGLRLDDGSAFPAQSAFERLAEDAYRRHLASITFRSGADSREIVTFLEALARDPEEISAAGGLSALLGKEHLGGISLAEAEVLLVEAEVLSTAAEQDGSAAEAEAEPVPTTVEAIDEAVGRALDGRPRERRAIAHVIGEPAMVREYLETVYRDSVDEGAVDELEEVMKRLSDLAHIARDVSTDRRLAHKLSLALSALDPELRRRILAEKVLREARTSEAMAELVRGLDPDDIVKILARAPEGAVFSEKQMLEGIRDLVAITGLKRADLAESAAEAMRAEGVPDSVAETVVELISPSRLIIRPGEEPPVEAESPADAVAKMLAEDGALSFQAADAAQNEDDLADLVQEAHAGVSDGDIIGTLVLLATLDVRPEQFASVMAVLEDSLSVLIGRGDIEVAAHTAELLREAARRPDLLPEQRQRLEQAVEQFARPEDVHALSRALRLHSADSAEHRAARDLLEGLGPLALQTMLEHLAEEPDMSTRKALLDLLSEISVSYVPQLAPYVADRRWYFVRNIVTILGATRSQTAVPLLERTLRHHDARVRRETVRALASIGGPVVARMLVAAISDEDASTVQAAIRALGTPGIEGAVIALETVASGEGVGNRENGPRIEAIETLGRIGTKRSLAVLERIAERRVLLGGQKSRELRSAAASAMHAITVRERREAL
ncbi:MAG: HEAT repeat domain-containing protein [Coriobacteriia bacterium]